MNLPDELLDGAWYWLAWCLWLPLLARAVWQADWRGLVNSERLNVWLGMVVVLVLIWSLKAGVKPGLDLHLLGAMAFTLVFEPALAFVGLNLVLAGITLNGALGWPEFALNSLVTIATAVGCSTLIYRFVARFLPRHFFVFVFMNGFFGAALSIIGVGLVSTLLYSLAGAYPPAYLVEEYLPYFLLLGFSEAWISGMVITLMLVYRPGWVSTFDDSIYSIGK